MILHLAYHDVLKRGEDRLPGIGTDYERFCKQMAYLRDNGWLVMNCGEFACALIEHCEKGASLPDRCATLSFDDGLKSGFSRVFPVLQKFGFSGTFFVIIETLPKRVPVVTKFQLLIGKVGAECLEREVLPAVLGMPYAMLLDPKHFDIGDYYANEAREVRRIKTVFNRFLPHPLRIEKSSQMFAKVFGPDAEERLAEEKFVSANNLCTMRECGMEIASHSISHPFVSILALSEVRRELEESQRELAQILGVVPAALPTFGWPFGGAFQPEILNCAMCYQSAWNFLITADMPQPPYNRWDIPRVDEKHFEAVLGIPPLS